MARTFRNHKIDTRSARARLPAKPAIYWTVIAPGCSVGYRKGRTGGVWIAKLVADGARSQTTIGRADDAMDPDGILSLSYSQAQDRARTWFAETAREQSGEKGSRDHYTVKACAEDYVAEQKRRGSKSLTDTISRVNAHIVPGLGETLVHKLTAQKIRDWHSAMATTPKRLRSQRGEGPRYRDRIDGAEGARKRKATANRTLSILKAALNHAFREGRVASDAEWRRVSPFHEVETARVRYLSAEECNRLIAAASEELRPLILAALATGCRYSELVDRL